MTKAMLTRRLAAVGFLTLALLAAVILFKVHGGALGQQIYDISRDFKEIAIALLAGYLAHAFQERSIFVRRLHELWSDIVNAKNEILQFTHDPVPTAAKFGAAHRILSQAIDDLRAVYANIGENKSRIGLFPFEPLHDMRRALDALGWAGATEADRKLARQRVLRAWNAIRYNFRTEFNPPRPSRPITTWFSGDPRRTNNETNLWSDYADKDGATAGDAATRIASTSRMS